MKFKELMGDIFEEGIDKKDLHSRLYKNGWSEGCWEKDNPKKYVDYYCSSRDMHYRYDLEIKNGKANVTEYTNYNPSNMHSVTKTKVINFKNNTDKLIEELNSFVPMFMG